MSKTLSILLVAGLSLCACSPSAPVEATSTPTSGEEVASGESTTAAFVVEVTTFRQNEAMSAATFAAADAQVQAQYTSLQPGFLHRISAQSPEGEWAVVVFWETLDDADASMQRFMSDASVADYAAAIDAPSMQMARYSAAGSYDEIAASPVVEVTTFRLAANVQADAFARRDAEIEASYTSAQPGFLRRESGVNDEGQWLVLVLWEDTASAEASMARFMGSESVSDYVAMIDTETMAMRRYSETP